MKKSKSSEETDAIIVGLGGKGFCSNSYLLIYRQKVIVVDCGTKSMANRICVALEERGLLKMNVEYIICTHTHFDHVGGMSYLKKKCPLAKLVVHKSEASNLVTGSCPLDDADPEVEKRIKKTHIPPKKRSVQLKNRIFRIGRFIFSPWVEKITPVKPDILMSKQILDLTSKIKYPCRLLHTPGHTKGSLCVQWGRRNMITGDLVVARCYDGFHSNFLQSDEKQLAAGNSMCVCSPWCPKELKESWAQLMLSGVEYVWPGHNHFINSVRRYKLKSFFQSLPMNCANKDKHHKDEEYDMNAWLKGYRFYRKGLKEFEEKDDDETVPMSEEMKMRRRSKKKFYFYKYLKWEEEKKESEGDMDRIVEDPWERFTSPIRKTPYVRRHRGRKKTKNKNKMKKAEKDKEIVEKAGKEKKKGKGKKKKRMEEEKEEEEEEEKEEIEEESSSEEEDDDEEEEEDDEEEEEEEEEKKKEKVTVEESSSEEEDVDEDEDDDTSS